LRVPGNKKNKKLISWELPIPQYLSSVSLIPYRELGYCRGIAEVFIDEEKRVNNG